ncbi:diaminopimelate decarboxylase [Taylorella equigenitalis]|uniref:diaminopimelate decarboxylase n=1 Tax=Taylorella equigenitalis TaxID=29575 RepID=UPI000421B4C8|nr:diaminopimelate decarboxylase [Taylorella equigenitalis]ASY31105.1 diaminopimelate decarboxylase [Taylorella equigenitalis]KOS58785.1 diaminopimelate decarboxylase [Taylorella equigenitalis]
MLFKPVSSPFIAYKNDKLYIESLSVKEIQNRLSTESPFVLYSKKAIESAWDGYKNILGKYPNSLICYAVKANSNLSLLKLFVSLGAGFDIVSGGELKRCLEVGADTNKIIFSGVGKQSWEIKLALESGIKCFNVESEFELENIATIARELGLKARISLRVNPDIDARTHPYISTGLKENKFGIDFSRALDVYLYAASIDVLEIVGIDCHIGSQILEIEPYLDAADRVIELIRQIRSHGIYLSHLDIGGGVGIRYSNENPIDIVCLRASIDAKLRSAGLEHMLVIMEPGRSLVGNSAILVAQVLGIKKTDYKNFAIINAGMNDLIRPSLYEAYHGVLPVQIRKGEATKYDIVGPICETGDWLAKDRKLVLQAGDLIAIESVGAYGTSMASNYNSRPFLAEYLVDDAELCMIRKAQGLEDIWRLEAELIS